MNNNLIAANWLFGIFQPTKKNKAPESRPAAAYNSDLYAPPKTRFGLVLFHLTTAAVLFMGWWVREEEYLIAEKGVGYYLGITGGIMMLLLVLYPLRKKLKVLRSFGAIKNWFHIHIVLGTLGPTLILFHANFQFGSLNSTIALISTLLVAGSGFFYMFIYTRIHYGLYSKQLTLQDLQKEIEDNSHHLKQLIENAPFLHKRIKKLEDVALTPPRGFFHSFYRFLNMNLSSRYIHLVLLVDARLAFKKTAMLHGWSRPKIRQQRTTLNRHLAAYISTVRMITRFSLYERIFAQWRLFHAPLFNLLIIVGVIHVIAVHMF